MLYILNLCTRVYRYENYYLPNYKIRKTLLYLCPYMSRIFIFIILFNKQENKKKEEEGFEINGKEGAERKR